MAIYQIRRKTSQQVTKVSTMSTVPVRGVGPMNVEDLLGHMILFYKGQIPLKGPIEVMKGNLSYVATTVAKYRLQVQIIT